MTIERVREISRYISFHEKFWDTHRAKSNYMKRLRKMRLAETRFLMETVLFPYFNKRMNDLLPEAVSNAMSKFVDIKDVKIGDKNSYIG